MPQAALENVNAMRASALAGRWLSNFPFDAQYFPIDCQETRVSERSPRAPKSVIRHMLYALCLNPILISLWEAS